MYVGYIFDVCKVFSTHLYKEVYLNICMYVCMYSMYTVEEDMGSFASLYGGILAEALILKPFFHIIKSIYTHMYACTYVYEPPSKIFFRDMPLVARPPGPWPVEESLSLSFNNHQHSKVFKSAYIHTLKMSRR